MNSSGVRFSARLVPATGNGVVEDPFVVLIDAETRAGILFRFGVLSNAETAVGIDAPRQLEPEFVFFPNFAGIDFARVVDRLAVALARGFITGWRKPSHCESCVS